MMLAPMLFSLLLSAPANLSGGEIATSTQALAPTLAGIDDGWVGFPIASESDDPAAIAALENLLRLD